MSFASCVVCSKIVLLLLFQLHEAFLLCLNQVTFINLGMCCKPRVCSQKIPLIYPSMSNDLTSTKLLTNCPSSAQLESSVVERANKISSFSCEKSIARSTFTLLFTARRFSSEDRLRSFVRWPWTRWSLPSSRTRSPS